MTAGSPVIEEGVARTHEVEWLRALAASAPEDEIVLALVASAYLSPLLRRIESLEIIRDLLQELVDNPDRTREVLASETARKAFVHTLAKLGPPLPRRDDA